MLKFKRLHIFVLKSFLPLFAMTFFIVLFIVLMQFLWRYIDDLVGKGLSLDVLAELFFYAAVSMVPMALPLAILLASLMTFGNFGEKFELTAMKASGISLVQVMKPLIVFIAIVAVGAFFFQNDILPKAQVKMWTLLFSARQKSPELEIPEGVFYDQIPGYNLFVTHKDRETGMLHDVMIYANATGGSNTTILVSDSAQLATTPDMRYLYLHLYKGEQFENLREASTTDRNVPFRRETFVDKQVLIPFDANFNRLDEEGMKKQYVGKNISELHQTIDSINLRVDSMGRVFDADLHFEAFPLLDLDDGSSSSRSYSKFNTFGSTSTSPGTYTAPSAGGASREQDLSDQMRKEQEKKKKDLIERKVSARPLDIDSLLAEMTPAQRSETFSVAHSIVARHKGELEFRAVEMAGENISIRRHKIELLKKFTLSVACLIFFFIGAPLGAIIRKGGLGTPLVISVLLFLVYYIIDNTGYKMARDGRTAVWLGMWLSTFILAPLSIYVTYKAMNDSAVFDADRYKTFFRKLLGLRSPRSVAYKEVIINDISAEDALDRLDRLTELCKRFLETHKLKMGYLAYFKKGWNIARVAYIVRALNDDIQYLSDSHDLKVVDFLSMYPDFGARRILHPARKPWQAWTLAIVFPVGLVVYAVGFVARRRLLADLRQTIDISTRISTRIHEIIDSQQSDSDSIQISTEESIN